MKTKNKYKVGDRFFFISNPSDIYIIKSVGEFTYYCEFITKNYAPMYNRKWLDNTAILATPLAMELYT